MQDENRDPESNENSNNQTSTSDQQSPLSQHRPLNRAYEPTPPNVTSADDEELRRAFI